MDNTGAMSPMPKYKCHKEVWALKIESVRPSTPALGSETDGSYNLIVEYPFAPITVSREWVKKHDPISGGYYVKYEDGYTSFSPAKAFEEGYSRI